MRVGVARCAARSVTGDDFSATLSRKTDSATGGKTVGDMHETATLAAGCFWCVEALFKRLEGGGG